MTPLRTIAVLLAFAPAAAWSQFTKTTEHPVVVELTADGFEVDGAAIKLLPPLVTPDMPSDAQRAAFAELVSERRMDKYLQDSVFASYKLDIDDLGETAGQGTVRRLDLYFVVHGSLKLIHEKELLSSLMGGDKAAAAVEDSGFETYAKPLDESAERSDDLPPAGELTSGMFRYRFPILEKVVVSGLASSAGMHVDGGIVQSAVSPRDRLDDADHPTEWRPIPRGAKSDDELGAAEPFKGFYCYLHAAQLGFVDNAVLIECHAAYIEPYGWFRGRNLLASKLPLLMQQNVRDFRRKLKKVQEEAK